MTAEQNGAGVEPAGWRPIASAPKDGTRIQAGHFDANGSGFRQYVCFWNPGWAIMKDERGQGPFWQAGGLLEYPTHWMPLPSPPAISKATPQGGVGSLPNRPLMQSVYDAEAKTFRTLILPQGGEDER